ncbi:ACP synthase, partial [Enterobacter hormaechei]
DSTAQTLPVSQLRFGSLSLAVCTPTPFTLTAEAVTYSGISAA